MRPYFEKMTEFGRPLKDGQIKRTEENVKLIKEEETKLAQEIERMKNVGLPEEKINARGQMKITLSMRGRDGQKETMAN